MLYPPTTAQQEKVVKALRKGNHARFEGTFFRVEVFRTHDGKGEAFVMTTERKADKQETVSEFTLRSVNELMTFMCDWEELSKWTFYNPYPQDVPVLSDEDMYELMNNEWKAGYPNG